MDWIGILKVVFAMSCCGTIFWGLWALYQFKTQRRSALAIGFMDCSIFVILTALLLFLFGVRQPVSSDGLNEVLNNIFHIISLVALALIVGSMTAVGCSSNPKVSRISCRISIASAGIWILVFMAEMLTIY